MKTIQFTEVGRFKAHWQETLPDLEELTIVKAVKRRKVLASKLLEAFSGCIYAGGRVVGYYQEVQ